MRWDTECLVLPTEYISKQTQNCFVCRESKRSDHTKSMSDLSLHALTPGQPGPAFVTKRAPKRGKRFHKRLAEVYVLASSMS